MATKEQYSGTPWPRPVLQPLGSIASGPKLSDRDENIPSKSRQGGPKLQPPTHFKTVYIGIGSNLGDKRQNCLRAIEKVEQIPGCKFTGRSGWYLTRPVGVKGQDWYVNGVVSISTKIPPQDLLRNLLDIEADMGRVRGNRWESRIIDLDILLYGHEIINDEDLTVPHPLMHLRKFVLVPLVQLAPDMIHPSLGVTMTELLRRIPKNGQEVVPLEDR
jgi:2-amino-4-hydroxy-6-hydroxymethyldihydropteridine diphosphokinase